MPVSPHRTSPLAALSSRALLAAPQGFICVDGTSLTVCEVSGTQLPARPPLEDASLTCPRRVPQVNQAEGWFDFMLVSFTQARRAAHRRAARRPNQPGRLSAPPQAHITLPRKAVGDAVNLEVDVTAKYVERSVGGLAQRVAELEAEVARLKAAQ